VCETRTHDFISCKIEKKEHFKILAHFRSFWLIITVVPGKTSAGFWETVMRSSRRIFEYLAPSLSWLPAKIRSSLHGENCDIKVIFGFFKLAKTSIFLKSKLPSKTSSTKQHRIYKTQQNVNTDAAYPKYSSRSTSTYLYTESFPYCARFTNQYLKKLYSVVNSKVNMRIFS